MTPTERIATARKDLLTAQQDLEAVLAKDNTRRRGPVVRQLHELRRMLQPDTPYVSQAGQDRVLDRLFNGKTGGVFVDIGGYDGVTGSNTLFFERHRNWTGVLVEPVQAQIDKARAQRRCSCLQYAVADNDGTAEFIEISSGFTQMSGLSGSYDAATLGQIRKDPRHHETLVRIATRTLSSLLDEARISSADFISLDIEGGEVAVLNTFPFDRYPVTAWAIENNTGSSDINRLMTSKGYDLIEFCGPDEIYRRRP